MTEPEQRGPADIATLLRTLGVGDSADFVLGRTITPGTFARVSQAGAAPDASDASGKATLIAGAAAEMSASIGPLPRIALSGAAVRAAEVAEADGGAPADFEVLRILGEGGMGRVHLARQRSLGRDVAIKSLKDDVADSRVAAMLRAEATVMGRLEHPNVVPVHAVGLDERGRLVLVMKRIDGVSWSELLKDTKHPRWASLLELAPSQLEFHLDVLAAVARALHFAHREGVIHRDVKPDNVLVGTHGDVYLADWGVALRTQEGRTEPELVGTPSYMAREMVVGDPSKIDARTDVYLLGATLYEVLTGRPPHLGANLQQILIAAYDPQPLVFGPDVPAELAAIVIKATATDPDDRYPTALAMRRALDDVRRHRGSIALVRSAQARMDELKQAPLGDPSVDSKLTEARFAYVQALRDWADNLEGQAGLRDCLRHSIRHEIARENAAGARALLAELKDDEPDLRAAIGSLERLLETRRAEQHRLKQIEAEQDLTVGHTARTAMVIGLIGLTVLLSIGIAVQTGGSTDALTAHELVWISGFLLCATSIPILIWRKRLLANAVGQRLGGLVVISCALLFLHRLLAASWGVDPAATLAMDLAIFVGIAGAAGAVVPRMAWGMLVPLIGAVLVSVWPARVAAIFSITGVFTLLALTLLLLSSYRTAARTR
jgi:serine/threonine-protein kinase